MGLLKINILLFLNHFASLMLHRLAKTRNMIQLGNVVVVLCTCTLKALTAP